MKRACFLFCLFIAAAVAFGAAPREKPIGVFDSGTGGLTVLEAILALDSFNNQTGATGTDGVPDFVAESFHYLADHANMPYGHYASVNKVDLLREHIVRSASFLLSNSNKPSVKMIVIACNTATAYGLDDVKNSGVPVVGVINAGVKAAMEHQKKHPGTIGVFATAGTVASGGYPNAIRKIAAGASIVSQGCVGLAECIDRDWSYFSDTAATVRTEYKGPSLTNKQLPIHPSLLPVYNFSAEKNKLLRRLDASGNCVELQLNDSANYVRYHLVTMLETMRRERYTAPLNTLILGCTHYPYLRETIATVLKELHEHRYRDVLAAHVELIDPAVETAKEAYLELRRQNLQRTGGGAVADAFFISVPNTSLTGVQLQPDGWFTYDYKYGRQAGTNLPFVRYLPFDTRNVPAEAYRRFRDVLPRVHEKLKAVVSGLSADDNLLAIQEGELPIILSAPHGGRVDIPGVPPRTGTGLPKGAGKFVTARDMNTEELTKEIVSALEARTGKKPYYVVARFHRKFVDANRRSEGAYEDPKAGRVYDAYHQALARFCEAVYTKHGCGLVLDIHGQSSAPDTIFRGTQNGKTVRLLVERLGEKAHIGPKSFCGLLAAQGLTVVPADASGETSAYTGGYIVQASGERAGIGAIQLEFGSNLRKKENLKDTAAKVADAIVAFSKLYLAAPSPTR
ncbi:MAG: hypothetical protein FJ395_07725 [Verrucomicrobia bacterium]|nr:hypothetical protein [Verrucomicrobiota bacterium]